MPSKAKTSTRNAKPSKASAPSARGEQSKKKSAQGRKSTGGGDEMFAQDDLNTPEALPQDDNREMSEDDENMDEKFQPLTPSQRGKNKEKTQSDKDSTRRSTK